MNLLESRTARRASKAPQPVGWPANHGRDGFQQGRARSSVLLWAALIVTLLSAAAFPLPPGKRISFVDVSAETGFREIIYGGVEHQKYILETTGTGVAIFDYDQDGRLDIFFVNGTRLDLASDQSPTNRLYRNLGEWRFEEVTVEAGLVHSGWGQGACVGDFDNDGWTDLFVSYYGENVLYRNQGDGSFTDVSEKAGIQAPRRWNSGCTFLDYNQDGHLDLFIANYVDFGDATRYEPGSVQTCKWRGIDVMCGPRGLATAKNILYRSNGDGTFTDVSISSGITEAEGFYCLMPVTLDFDRDGWTDLYVACDGAPNILYHNSGDGTFTDVAMESGTAVDENGEEQSGMGVSVGDYDSDGHLDVLVTNFSDETPTLYHNDGSGAFTDTTFAAKLGHERKYVSWGVGLIDLDNDGWKDIFIANGHVYPEVDRYPSETTYRQAKQVFRNLGNGTFQDISRSAGAAIQAEKASRGAACGDLDGDGDLDIIVVNLNERPSVLRNDGEQANNWLVVRLEGAQSNRSGIGARIQVTAGGRTQTDEVRSAGSYYSSDGLRVHFGLGRAPEAERIEIRWPSGARQVFKNVKGNRLVFIHETEGIEEGRFDESLDSSE